MASRFDFNYRQSVNPKTIISKEKSVCVINLLALLRENKDIVDVVKSSLCIIFCQTMMKIDSNSSIGGIKPIAFE
jgi:hypothetical protein